jgi:hypothetical protein
VSRSLQLSSKARERSQAHKSAPQKRDWQALQKTSNDLSMRLIIRPNAASVAEWVSRYVVKRIKDFAPTADVRYSHNPSSNVNSLLLLQNPTCLRTCIHAIHLRQRPFVLGLPTGSTPLKTYEALIRMHKNGEVIICASLCQPLLNAVKNHLNFAADLLSSRRNFQHG